MSEVLEEVETHELTYDGIVDLAVGTLMGRSMHGKIWSVTGCVYNPITHKTKVYFEEFIQQ